MLVLSACGFEVTAALPGGDAPGDARGDAPLVARTVTFRQGVEGYAGTADTYISDLVGTPLGDTPTFIWDLVSAEEHALLRFDDVFGAAATQIPPDAPIMAATLRLRIVDGTNDVGTIREVAVPWDEATVWGTFGAQAGVQGADLGADVGPAPTSGRPTIDVTASVARWSSAPASNLGWLFSPGGPDGCDVASSEEGDEADRPTLEVTFLGSP